MMSLFDEEQIMKSFIRSERHDEARETAGKNGKTITFINQNKYSNSVRAYSN